MILFIWILCTIIVAMYASSRDRNPFAWAFVSLLISPLIAFVILLVMGKAKKEVKK